MWTGGPWIDRFGDDLDQLRAIPWWLFIVTGALWMVFAFIVLSFDFRTVWAIALFAGASFIVAGVNEFWTASMVPRRQWLHVALGALFLGAGVVAIVWPTITFVALAAIIGWFLLFSGAFDIVGAVMDRHDLWWLRLIAGVIELGLGFWAIGYPGRSFTLLAVWVAAAALTRGFGQILLGFALRDATRDAEWRSAGSPSSTDDRTSGWSGAPGPGPAPASAPMSNPGHNGDAHNGAGRGGIDLREGDQRLIDEFRSRGGQMTGDLAGEHVLLLHSTDAHGQEKISPVCYWLEGERFIVYPMRAGGGGTPEWYANLLTDSRGSIETGQRNVQIEAHVPTSEEERRLRGDQRRGVAPGAGSATEAASRVRPVLILELVEA